MVDDQISIGPYRCTPNDGSIAHVAAGSVKKHQPKKRQHKYSRGGCLTCKSKKVKCDEHKPVCLRCRRLHLDCAYQPFKFEPVVKGGSFPHAPKFTKVVFKNVQISGQGPPEGPAAGGGQAEEAVQRRGNEQTGIPAVLEAPLLACSGESHTDTTAGKPTMDPFSRQIANMLANQEHLVGDILEENKRYSAPGSVPLLPTENAASDSMQQPMHLFPTLSSGSETNDAPETAGQGFQNFAALFFDPVPALEASSGVQMSEPEPQQPVLGDIRAPQEEERSNNNNSNSSSNVGEGEVRVDSGRGFEPREYDFLQCLARSDSKEKMDVLCNSLGLSWRESVDFRSFMLNIQPTLNPFASSYFDSSTTVVLLEKARTSPYLLNAMLACGSRYLIEKLVSIRRRLENENQDENKNDRDKDYTVEKKQSGQLATIGKRIRQIKADRTRYLSNCYRHLKNLLEKPERMPAEAESALLTSIILTADLSSFSDSHWSVHLKGAKQFLWDYVECGRPITDTIIISKYLLASLEISILMLTPESLLDPSVISLAELNRAYPVPVNYAPMPELYRLGMIEDGFRLRTAPDGTRTEAFAQGTFKLYLGYTDDVMSVIKAIIHARGHAAETGQVVDPLYVCKIFALIAQAKNSYLVVKDAPFQIPLTSRYHPYYVGVDKTRAFPASYAHIKSASPDPCKCWFSYFDFCNQARVDALHLYVLVSNTFMGMGPTNQHVRRLFQQVIKDVGFLIHFTHGHLSDDDLQLLDRHYNRKIILSDPADIAELNSDDNTVIVTPEKINLVCENELKNTFRHSVNYDKYLECHIDHRICMVQWCLLIFGFCCTTPREKIIIESLLMRLLKVGIKSGRLSLEKLSRVWTLRRIRYRSSSGTLFRLHPDYDNEFFRDESKGILFT